MRNLRKMIVFVAVLMSLSFGFSQTRIQWQGIEFTCPEGVCCDGAAGGKDSHIQHESEADQRYRLYVSVRSVDEFTRQLGTYDADDGGEEFRRHYKGSKKRLLNDVMNGKFDFATGNILTLDGDANVLKINGKKRGTYGYFIYSEALKVNRLGEYALYFTDGKNMYKFLFENRTPVSEVAEKLPEYCEYREHDSEGAGYFWIIDKVKPFISDMQRLKKTLPEPILAFERDWKTIISSITFLE